jgi:(p)ppGpp synthase/HD superfamily hydrolase
VLFPNPLTTALRGHWLVTMPWSPDQAARALELAAEKPYSYVVHLASAAMEVMAAVSFSPHLNADLAIQCALLHDVLEDTDTPAF